MNACVIACVRVCVWVNVGVFVRGRGSLSVCIFVSLHTRVSAVSNSTGSLDQRIMYKQLQTPLPAALLSPFSPFPPTPTATVPLDVLF